MVKWKLERQGPADDPDPERAMYEIIDDATEAELAEAIRRVWVRSKPQ